MHCMFSVYNDWFCISHLSIMHIFYYAIFLGSIPETQIFLSEFKQRCQQVYISWFIFRKNCKMNVFHIELGFYISSVIILSRYIVTQKLTFSTSFPAKFDGIIDQMGVFRCSKNEMQQRWYWMCAHVKQPLSPTAG